MPGPQQDNLDSSTPDAVDSSTHAVDECTRKLLREFAASLGHMYNVIGRLLDDAGDAQPLPEITFRDFVSASARWYTMIAGPNPGVFQGLQNVPNRAVPNAVIGRHKTEEEARKVFNEALDNGSVKQISDGTTVVLTWADVYGV